MLGLTSIQHTSHRLEDCFKVLKEHPVQVDEKLESLFLGVSDTLKALLEHLSGPYGLSEETANTLMSETEPVFQWLNEHLEQLVEQGNSGAGASSAREQGSSVENVSTLTELFLRRDIPNLTEEGHQESEISFAVAPQEVLSTASSKENRDWSDFQTQVLQTLREMLQLFKQTTTSSTRQNLQECCHQLVKLGESWNLSNWCSLCQAAASAIANPENTYLTLAKIVITEIKQAQELVLQGKEAEIAISEQLKALLTFAEIELSKITSNLVSEQSPAKSNAQETEDAQEFITNFSEPIEQLNLEELQQTSPNHGIETSFSFTPHEEVHPISKNLDPNGPEVGIAELNTLADLFEGETPDLDEPWHQEETLEITSSDELGINFNNNEPEDSDGDLSDLLSFDEDTSNEQQTTTTAKTEDLSLLFGDNFLDKENSELRNQQIPVTNLELNDINELDFNLDADSEAILSELTEQKNPDIVPNTIDDDNDVVADLLSLTLDEPELLIPGEVTQPENDTFASIELSSNQENTFNNLFLETENKNWVEEITPNDYVELSQTTDLSLDNLFGEPEEHPVTSNNDSEIGDLFDITSINTSDFSPVEDDLSNFWREENSEEKSQNEFEFLVEPNLKNFLEENLFTASNDDIFSDNQNPQSAAIDDFDIEDFHLDLTLSSEAGDDLFEESKLINSTILPEINEVGILEESAPLFASDSRDEEIHSSSQQPETVDFIPEFTNQLSEISAVDATQTSSDLEPLEENPQLLFEDVAVDDSTYIQMEIPDDVVAELSILETSELSPGQTDDLFGSFAENPQLLFEDVAVDDSTYIQMETPDDVVAELSILENSTLFDIGSEVLDPENNNLETTLEFAENTNLENQEIGFINDLLASAENLATNELVETISSETGETDSNREANLLNLAETSEAAPVLESENAVAVTEELIQTQTVEEVTSEDEFANLEALLGEKIAPLEKTQEMPEVDFAALEELLGTDNNQGAVSRDVSDKLRQHQPLTQPVPAKTPPPAPRVDEFSDLEKLLAEADQTISHSALTKPNTTKTPRPSTRRTARFEETMKVPVKQLDDMSNLVGELVVNRNTLEQDHERLRQSLDNLLIQVQQLSDVGARMQELYERSLLEASLLAGRKAKESGVNSQDSNSDRGFSELEMDRFTPFHTLSQQMIERIVRVRESASDIDFVTEETERVARQFRQVTTQLQEGLTRARMVPFAQTIDRWRRGVRDNAIKCGKQVELVIEGGDTLIDKMILDHLSDPLTHMLNNAIAHGIETPEQRQGAGKPPVGIITIRAFHQGNQTVISVGDDGAGIDPARVKAKAVKIGMITEAQAKTMSRLEVYDLLFQSGFSIKDQADEISGRGVGMDVVRSAISEIRGTVNTDSAIGKGTTFTIRLPLTLSICKALCCVSDRARIAFPMDGVEDTLDIPMKNIQHNANGQSFISWRDTLLPFRPLKELLTFNRQISRGNVYGGNRDDDMVSVVVVRSANTLIALQIDLVLSEQEIVIKQFEGPAPKPIGVAGATVLGDGRIMPIADVLEIIDIFQGRISTQIGGSSWQQKASSTDAPATKIDPTVLIVDDSITVRELLSLTFNKAGYRVEQARDGQEAWDKLRSGLPCDIVFCDIEMPRCDGLELLSRIQKDSNLNHLPIAMLTSRGADKHRQMAVQLGASGYFTKPYLEEALLEAASRMLKGEKLVS